MIGVVRSRWLAVIRHLGRHGDIALVPTMEIDMDDGTSDFRGPRDDLRNDQHAPGRIAMSVTGHFDQPQGVLEQRGALKELGHPFHTLTNPIADDQQQKPSVT